MKSLVLNLLADGLGEGVELGEKPLLAGGLAVKAEKLAMLLHPQFYFFL